MVKAILFDLDGVLVDAPELHRKAFDLTLENWNVAPLSEKEHIEKFNGLSTYKKLDILQNQGRINLIEQERKSFYDQKQLWTIELINEYIKPDERITSVVRETIMGGFSLGVVTNCSRMTCNLMLKRAALLDDFIKSPIITNEDVNGKVKPHPKPYRMAVRALELKPTEVLAIDDTKKGVTSAMNAGCYVWHLMNYKDLTVKNLGGILSEAARYEPR